jgi:hypothetical protein
MQCEGYRRYGGALTIGLPRWEQCKNEAIVILEIKQKTIQKLPACNICWQESIESDTIEIINVEPILKSS